MRFAIPRVSFYLTGKNASVKELQERIAEMKTALSPLLTDKAKDAYWSEWEYHVVDSALSVGTDKKAYYSLRTIALISSITVPSLVGLNLSGTGGTVVRWLTFAFGLVTAITTGMLTLYRLDDRWLMYRKLNQDLIKIGWTLVDNSGTDPKKAWESFTKATDKAMTDYNNTYAHAVIQTSVSATGDRGPGRALTDDHV